jgi:hypothetical protein
MFKRHLNDDYHGSRPLSKICRLPDAILVAQSFKYSLFIFQLSHGFGRESQGDPAGCLLSHRLHVFREKGEQGAGRVWHAVSEFIDNNL